MRLIDMTAEQIAAHPSVETVQDVEMVIEAGQIHAMRYIQPVDLNRAVFHALPGAPPVVVTMDKQGHKIQITRQAGSTAARVARVIRIVMFKESHLFKPTHVSNSIH